MARLTLFSTQASDGQSSSFQYVPTRSDPDGGAFSLQLAGTFNSVTVKLQHSCDGGSTWADVTDGSFTAVGSGGHFECLPGELFRLDLSGTGSPAPSVNAYAAGSIETV